jgi:GTP cyclohydrolase II
MSTHENKARARAAAGILWRVAATRMPTEWGMFGAIGFERQVSNGSKPDETALAIVLGELTSGAPLLRIRSQCFTGKVLGSLRCDCSGQLEMANSHSFASPRAKKKKLGQTLTLHMECVA